MSAPSAERRTFFDRSVWIHEDACAVYLCQWQQPLVVEHFAFLSIGAVIEMAKGSIAMMPNGKKRKGETHHYYTH
jgi:hypothetical protein